jgi:hypothetical protein
MFKQLPEIESYVNKAVRNVQATIDFNTVLFIKSLEYFNTVTDKAFFAWTNQVADSLNTASDYAKENVTESTTKVTKLFANGK